LLDVRSLKTHVFSSRGVVRAVDGVNLAIGVEETLGLVGETGSGKSMTALSIMRMIPYPGRIVEGKILLEGEDLLTKTQAQMTNIRGSKISMIFQDPMTSLNPVFKAGYQVSEAISTHQQLATSESWKRAVEMLNLVRIPDAPTRAHDYPHQLSGGMRQRTMIAMALSCRPKLLIADEPTTALDVTVQAQILELMRELRRRAGTSILLITHNLGVVAEICDRVAVMYAGKIVESADVKTIFRKHKHPYTKGLLGALPKIGSYKENLESILGSVPDMINPPSGCRFHPRCPHAKETCSLTEPRLVELEQEHMVACHFVRD